MKARGRGAAEAPLPFVPISDTWMRPFQHATNSVRVGSLVEPNDFGGVSQNATLPGRMVPDHWHIAVRSLWTEKAMLNR
jgi:hypothetical protein